MALVLKTRTLLLIGLAGASLAGVTVLPWSPSQLLAEDPDLRQAAFKATMEARLSLVGAARNVLRQPGTDFPSLRQKRSAAELLGLLRAPEGVAALLDDIAVDMRLAQMETLPKVHYYPAAWALVHIGLPSVEPALQRLATVDDPLEREMCARVILEIEGKRTGKAILEDALAAASTDEERGRIREALKLAE